MIAGGSRTKYAIRGVLTLIFVSLLVYYLVSHREELSVVRQLNSEKILYLLLIALLNLLFRSGHFAALYQLLGARVGLAESLGLSAVASSVNMLLPAQAGGVSRAVYLKRRHHLPYSRVPIIFAASVLFSLFVGSMLLAAVGMLLIVDGHSVPLVLWLTVLATFSTALLFFLDVPKSWLSAMGRAGQHLDQIIDGWRSIRQGRRWFLTAGLYQLLTHVSFGLLILASYEGLGLTLEPVFALGMAVTISLTNLVIITPGNIGLQEFLLGFLAQAGGITFSQGVVAAALIRAVLLVVTLAIAPFGWYFLFLRSSSSVQPADMEGG
jgi:uncharacterized membrane protein YbhN (UPF0104 family)